MVNIELTQEEAQTMIYALKIVKHFAPKEVNEEHKTLYDKLRPLLWESKKFEWYNQ